MPDLYTRDQPDQSERLYASELVCQLDEVAGALEGLTRALDGDEDLPVVLRRCCELAVQAIPGADRASVTLLREGEPFTPAATDEHTGEVDAAQYAAGQGPCLEAARTSRVVRVTVPEVAARWPDFARAAEGIGVRSYLSAPLFIDREYHGSLNLYGHAPGAFAALDATLLELYTTAVEAAVRAERRYRATRALAGQLRQALHSRAVIDQAKGIIMAAHRIDADAAFRWLVERSQRDNRKVHDIAAQLVADLTARDPD